MVRGETKPLIGLDSGPLMLTFGHVNFKKPFREEGIFGPDCTTGVVLLKAEANGPKGFDLPFGKVTLSRDWSMTRTMAKTDF